ncbi:MAG: hypothetical protein KF770_00240 [Anaerolineae bacterium]|nr:hypothetical protein [Anaerolineae bacterium]
MIAAYLDLVARIHQEVKDLERVVARAERGVQAAHERPEDQDLYFDSAALNLHDFYAGLERIFQQIGAVVDGKIPGGGNWHRELLQQMQTDIPELRPPVLSAESVTAVDEFLRFRHVLRNIYAFQFDPERIARLVSQMRPAWGQVQTELLAFAYFLEQVAKGE